MKQRVQQGRNQGPSRTWTEDTGKRYVGSNTPKNEKQNS